MFKLVEKALGGDVVEFVHKGVRIRLVPEGQPADKLSRITPLGSSIFIGTADELIDAAITITSVNGAKFDALGAHHSQIADSFWMKMGRERFLETMTTEWFIRATNPNALSGLVHDIFSGYR